MAELDSSKTSSSPSDGGGGGGDDGPKNRTLHIAVIGCSHGEIDTIYERIRAIELERAIKVELVLCCGDFQSVRNMTDLRCMNCPIKYQAMHDFHRYYSGEKIAPILTIFIGGNHEASNFLQELPFGGWVAPNIFFCGYSNVLRLGSLRIAGISGIFKGHDYTKGRYECPPYDQNSIRSTYHYRNLDVFRLKQIKSHIDIMLSHDWPRGIHNFGNVDALLRRKPFFREEVARNELGSRPLFELMTQLEPSFWFSAHMHVQFSATVPYTPTTTVPAPPRDAESTDSNHQQPKVTRFLALDKVLPRRHFLQVLDIPITTEAGDPEQLHLSYDPEWLAILKSTNHLTSPNPRPCFMPGPGCGGRYDFTPSQEELEDINKLFGNEFTIPNNFIQTGPPFQPGEKPGIAYPIENPQTVAFCEKLGITDPIKLCTRAGSNPFGSGGRGMQHQRHQQNVIGLSNSNPSGPVGRRSGPFQQYSSILPSVTTITPQNSSGPAAAASSDGGSKNTNPDEILLDDMDDDEDEDQDRLSTPRSKLSLPPPKSFSDDVHSRRNEGDSKDQAQNDSSASTPTQHQGNGQNQEDLKDLFVIDKTGASASADSFKEGLPNNLESESPDAKRKRNEALFAALEAEDDL